MVVISSVPPFFEPSAPPPTVPLLTTHTEFRKASKTSLTAQELPVPLKPKTIRFITDAAGGAAPSPSTNDDDHSTDSSLSSDSEDYEEDPPEDHLIPKPEGENGRPGRGGYNLELALGWDSKAFRKFKVFIHKCAHEHLDTSSSFSYQSLAALRNIRLLAVQQFPHLEQYRDIWPVDDVLRLHLKNASAKWKRQERQKAAAQVLDSVSKVDKSRRGKKKGKH